MAYQFGHINAYSRSGSSKNLEPKTTAGCLGEAFRDDGYATHVEKPEEPILILGSRENIDVALKTYREWFRDSRGHKLRKDGKELLAGVFSWPPGTTKNTYLDGLPILISFLKKKYGSSLRCVLSHEDESFFDETGKYHGEIHYHVHFFIVPEPNENFRDYHPGIKAKWQAKKDGLNHWEADQQYKWKMGDWQDELYREVGLPLELVKARPKELQEKRLSRREQKIISAAKEISINIQAEAKEKVDALNAEAEIVKTEKENMKFTAKQEAEKIIEIAESKVLSANVEVIVLEVIKSELNEEIEKTQLEAKQDADKVIQESESEAAKIMIAAKKEGQSEAEKIKIAAKKEGQYEAEKIKEAAKAEANKIIENAEFAEKKIKGEAWNTAADITHASERTAAKHIDSAKGFVNNLLDEVSKLPGGESIVKWARTFIKYVTERGRQSSKIVEKDKMKKDHGR
jgi:hypothetical protein